MSATGQRLNEVFQAADELPLDDNSRYILFSDCHRGDNGWADDFAPNQNLFFHALTYYHREGFTYIEVGDGDELWENASFDAIREAHSHVYWLMSQFYKAQRLHLIWGNHNAEWQDQAQVEKNLYHYIDQQDQQQKALFPGIKVHEGLVLNHAASSKKILVVHGHQGDAINDGGWRLGRFLVRYGWRQLQLIGVHDPTSPAKNFRKRGKVEQEIMAWIAANENQMVICGHTHRSVFPNRGAPNYFNTGSCVHPRAITGLEIQNGEIMLIKWSIKPDEQGVLHIARDLLEPAAKLEHFLVES